MAGLYFEDFEIGAEFRHEWTRTVTETDTIMYCALSMNVAPIHLDALYMESSFYGQRLVPSLYTAALIGGMLVPDLTLGTTLGNLGYTKFDFPKPVFHGDTLRAESTILDKRESRSRKDSGIVYFEHRGLNQHDEIVHIAHRAGLMLKRGFDMSGEGK
jgi:acyl dehydratase